MAILFAILSALLFAGGVACLPRRPLLAPGLAYLGLLSLSLCKNAYGDPWIPLNGTILTMWLCMTVVVMAATIMQPSELRRSLTGMGYLISGTVVGMVIGLLGYTFAANLSLLYGIMIVCTAAGTFFGLLLYSRTPQGTRLAPATGRFLPYLLAKGFPAAITVMQIGVVLVILIALYNNK